MSNRMDWETPQSLFDELDREFHFTLDAASSDVNAKCAKHYTIDDSAFTHEWGGEYRLLQSALRAPDRRMGQEMQHGGEPREHDRRHAPARPH